MNYLKSLFLFCLTVMMLAGTGQASTLYSAPPNQSGGSDLNGFLEADNVVFASPVNVTQIMFWSAQTSAADYAGSIAWSFNLNSSGVPGASVASGLATPAPVLTGLSLFGLSEYSYTFPVNVALGPGNYWVVLHNGPTNSIPSTDFFWEWSNGNSGDSQSQDLSFPNQPWIGNFAELALDLQGTGTRNDVPEPSSIIQLGIGLAGVLTIQYKKRK